MTLSKGQTAFLPYASYPYYLSLTNNTTLVHIPCVNKILAARTQDVDVSQIESLHDAYLTEHGDSHTFSKVSSSVLKWLKKKE